MSIYANYQPLIFVLFSNLANCFSVVALYVLITKGIIEQIMVAVDIQHFETNVKVAVSDGFVSWIMQFGDKIKVIRPNHLADSVSSKAKKIASVYEEKGKGATYC